MERNKLKIGSFVRYRFLLFAGIFPYILGSFVARRYTGLFEPSYFWVGLFGVVMVLAGVEALNEYFDFKIGGDRAFLMQKRQIPNHYLRIGILAFSLALFVLIYLAFVRGLPLLIFGIIGAFSAFFYVAPPIQWSYRGFGELVIFLNYGPLITTGSYYLQAQRIDPISILVSLVPGFLILSICLINEVPDYYGDRLVGKKNIVVRFGRKGTVTLYGVILFCSFILIGINALNGFSPMLLLSFSVLPVAYWSLSVARENYETPIRFIPAIGGTIFIYTLLMSFFIISFV